MRRCVIVLCLLAATSVAPLQARGKWYDHYADALQAIEDGDPGQAIELLEAALERKRASGYFRTYGNNYIRYVPQFWLGVAHHDLGDCEQALTRFERAEAADETHDAPALAARMSGLRSACRARLAPPPDPPAVVAEAEPPAPVEQRPPAAPSPVEQVDPGLLEEGLRTYLQGDFSGSAARFESLVEVAPRSASMRLLWGMALHGAWVVGGERDAALIERARRELAQAARLDPGLSPDPAVCPPRVVALYRSLR